MRRMLSKLQQQRGQVVIMFVGIFTVITVVGVITVDLGLWFSERRGAQTDADFPALAGARECMLELASDGAYPADVQGAVQRLFDQNNGGNAELVPSGTSSGCELQDNGQLCVRVTVKHDSETLFSSFYSPIFDELSDNVGAYAKACAGAANNPINVVPFETETPGPCFDAGLPRFGEVCALEGGSQDPNPRGMLDLQAAEQYCSDANGSGDIENLIANGVPGTCLINEEGLCDPSRNGPWYYCVAVQDGNTQEVIRGTQARIAREGGCDANGDGVDSFEESVITLVNSANPAERVYEAKDCDADTEGIQISPRLVTVIVLDEVSVPGNTGYPIAAFAGFYLEGCAPQSKVIQSGNDLDECELQCMERRRPNQPGNCRRPNQTGQQTVYGTFMNLIVAGSGIGPVDPSSTMFGIALTE